MTMTNDYVIMTHLHPWELCQPRFQLFSSAQPVEVNFWYFIDTTEMDTHIFIDSTHRNQTTETETHIFIKSTHCKQTTQTDTHIFINSTRRNQTSILIFSSFYPDTIYTIRTTHTLHLPALLQAALHLLQLLQQLQVVVQSLSLAFGNGPSRMSQGKL